MKISKKDLRRLIMENVNSLLGEEEAEQEEDFQDNFLMTMPVVDQDLENSEDVPYGKQLEVTKDNTVEFYAPDSDVLAILPIDFSDDPNNIVDTSVANNIDKIVFNEDNTLGIKNENDRNLTIINDPGKYTIVMGNIESTIPTFENLQNRYASQDAELDAEPDAELDAKPKTDPQTSQDTSTKTKTSIPVREKTKQIQQVIKAPSSKDGNQLGDGQWGTKTTEAWKKWVVDSKTIEVMKDLKSEKESSRVNKESFSRADLRNLFERIIGDNRLLREQDETSSDEFKEFINKNAGDASAIAKHVGFGGGLSGVYELVMAVSKRQNSDEEPKARVGDEDEDTSVESSKAPGADENLKISDLKLSIERFKNRGGIRKAGDKNSTEVVLDKPPPAIIQGGGASKNKELKNYRNLRLRDEDSKKYIVISPKPLRGSLKRYKLGPVKIEGDYVVLDKAANESLSHGALIRKRYRRY